MLPKRGRGSAAAMYSAISTTWVTAPPSVPPDIKIMSGRMVRIRSIFSYGSRPSLEASTSITMAPAPSAARWALSPVMFCTTPVTIICNPPPALLVET